MSDHNRRELALGAAAVGLAAAAGPALAATPTAGPILRGYQPCRFGQVHYRYSQPAARAAARTPLLCLHASPRSSIAYLDFLPVMGADRLTIAADTPGYGMSDRPPSPPSIEDLAAAMGDLIDNLGLAQVDVIGTHTGSATALELGRQRPKQVRKVIVSSALMFTAQDKADYAARTAANVPPSLDAAIASLPERWARQRKFAAPGWSEADVWLSFWESSRDMTHSHWAYNASFVYDFQKTLAALVQPLLILNPHDDLYEITARARGRIRNGRLQDLPFASGTFQAHAAETGAAVRAFLDA